MSDTMEVPNFTAAENVFGARLDQYPNYETLPYEFRNMKGQFCDVASKLFFNGGRLSDFGLSYKSGIDVSKAQRAIQAWLCSFEPKHEHKIATVGYALSKWCEPMPMQNSVDHEVRQAVKAGKKAKRSRKAFRNRGAA